MNKEKKQFKNVDEYIHSFPTNVRKFLTQMRTAVTKAAPGAQEKISWQMPGYFQNGILVFYAAHRSHIGFYALPGAIKAFQKELQEFPVSKGTIRFPFARPLPLGLIGKIVKYRIKENGMKARAKKTGDD
jgi:uncharacterized protein YdhG (YjbR/CyaY superfamily)